MTVVLDELVRSALKELADHDYQTRVWTGRGGEDEMASFEECVARLFNDSGLEIALDRDEPAYGDEIDRDLRALGDLVARIDSFGSPDEIIDDPLMGQARRRAAAILDAISKDEGHDAPR